MNAKHGIALSLACLLFCGCRNEEQRAAKPPSDTKESGEAPPPVLKSEPWNEKPMSHPFPDPARPTAPVSGNLRVLDEEGRPIVGVKVVFGRISEESVAPHVSRMIEVLENAVSGVDGSARMDGEGAWRIVDYSKEGYRKADENPASLAAFSSLQQGGQAPEVILMSGAFSTRAKRVTAAVGPVAIEEEALIRVPLIEHPEQRAAGYLEVRRTGPETLSIRPSGSREEQVLGISEGDPPSFGRWRLFFKDAGGQRGFLGLVESPRSFDGRITFALSGWWSAADSDDPVTGRQEKPMTSAEELQRRIDAVTEP